MTVRQIVWFLAAHIALVALAIWVDLAVLCRGAVKYDGGCGGFGVYIPLWIVFLAPLPLAAIILERWKCAQPPPSSRLVVYLVGILIVAELGFLIIDRFPILLGVEAAAIAVATIARRQMSKLALPDTL
jgi:hypothetical protein